MTSRARAIRRASSASTPLVVGALLIAAAVLVGVGQIKHASVVRALRHTSPVTATVLSVGRDRVANVRYVLGGKPHTGHVSAAQGVDSGDGLALRVASAGGGLQLATPFYATVYPATAAALTVIAVVIIGWSRRSSASPARRSRTPWMPAELSRPHRQAHHRGDGPARRPD
jgi:hypothetical protein